MQYGLAMRRLREALRVARGWLSEDVAVAPGGPGPAPGSDTLFSHGGLRRAVGFLTQMAALLPEDDVLWQVQPLLLLREPFLDAARSDPRARTILMRGTLALLGTLRERGLPTADAAAGAGALLAGVLGDLGRACPLLTAIFMVSRGRDAVCHPSYWRNSLYVLSSVAGQLWDKP